MAEKRLKAIVDAHLGELEQAKEEVRSLVTSTVPARLKMKKYIKISSKLGDIIGPHTICKSGCSHCCHMAVAISQVEARIIGEAIGVKPVELPVRSPEEVDTIQSRFLREPCVFLTEGKCSIYDNRPSVCRTYFNVGDDPSVCDLYREDPQSVPAIDLTPVWYAYTMMFLWTPFGDIREFFPNGLGDKPG